MGKYFGTDGIRGVAGVGLTAELAFKTGLALAETLSENGNDNMRIMIGKDTRVSCDMLESALTAGLCAGGAGVMRLGVLPTPAVAFLTIRNSFDAGVVISASHNSYEHNGIKIFGGDGFKLSDELELKIEQFIDCSVNLTQKTHSEIGGIISDLKFTASDYIDLLKNINNVKYSGKILIDCANGAASQTARTLFTALESDFKIISESPNGININDNCGSTYMDTLRKKVLSGGFDIGIAFDGDADRCLAVDEKGDIVDGDMMLAIFANRMLEDGTLKGGGIVGTIISNSGMDVFFEQKENCRFLRADVGDKNVLDMMQKTGCNLGGENSGHMIFSDYATTGDGQLTAVMLLKALAQSEKRLSELTCDLKRFPQVMPSYILTEGAERRDAIMASEKLRDAVDKANALLGGNGRVFIRPSGTEPVIRVLVEAESEDKANAIAADFITLIPTL